MQMCWHVGMQVCRSAGMSVCISVCRSVSVCVFMHGCTTYLIDPCVAVGLVRFDSPATDSQVRALSKEKQQSANLVTRAIDRTAGP